jgi:hypothetical protein
VGSTALASTSASLSDANPKLPAGTNFCLCRVCCLYFRSVSGFDAHRVSGRCLTQDELRARGYEPSQDGYWRIPAREWTHDYHFAAEVSQ